MRKLVIVCLAIAFAGGAYLIFGQTDTVAQSCVQTNTCP